ncbi:MAG: sugar ABC transporter substrate-binding protein [Chloroflexaceae bacterium]|nr:sugar ABC transporter substrate-binding protein [Chloroflexaceae bacterium]
MMNKRSFGMGLTLALLLPVIAACGGGGTTTSPGASATNVPATGATSVAPTAGAGAGTTGTAPAGAGTTGTAPAGTTAGALDFSQLQVEQGAQLRFSAAGNATEQQLYQSGADRFNQLFADQGVRMTFEPVPSEYETTITAGFSGNNAPDVFLLNGQLMGQLAPQGLLLPLDEAMQAVGRNANDFYQPLLELYQQDGQTYGLPKDFNPLVLFINTELAQQAGVDPASITTWDAFRDAATKMSQGQGGNSVSGVCFDPNILRFAPFLFQEGNAVIENNQAVFNQETGVRAIQFWRDLQQSGAASTWQDLGANWCGEAFARQRAAMVVEGGWLVPFMTDPQQGGTNVQYTAVQLPQPQGGQEGTILFTNAFAANANTQYPQAAAAAVLFLTSEANQRELIQSGLAQASLQSLSDDPFYDQNPVAQVLVDAADQNGRVAETVFGGPQRQADVIRLINQRAIEPIFVGGADVKQSLDQAAQEVNQALSR